MRRWIFAMILLLTAAPAVMADGHGRGRGRGYAHGHYKKRFYGPPPRVYYAPQARVAYGWAPAYGVMPVAYRGRMRPAPMMYYEDYGPVAPGCRRGFIDGYIVDYRPQNFLVVSFSRVW